MSSLAPVPRSSTTAQTDLLRAGTDPSSSQRAASVGDRGEPLPLEHGLDRLPVLLGHAAEHEVRVARPVLGR